MPLLISSVLFGHRISVLHVIYIYVTGMSLVRHCAVLRKRTCSNVYYTCDICSTFQRTDHPVPLWASICESYDNEPHQSYNQSS